MKNNWTIDELIENYTFLPNELKKITNKSEKSRIGFAVTFKFFQNEARFPNQKDEISFVIIKYIAKQIGANPELFNEYKYDNRTFYYHKKEIREFFNFREVTENDQIEIKNWLIKSININNVSLESNKEKVYSRFRELMIEPPASEKILRIVKSALKSFEMEFFRKIYSKLSNTSIPSTTSETAIPRPKLFIVSTLLVYEDINKGPLVNFTFMLKIRRSIMINHWNY